MNVHCATLSSIILLHVCLSERACVCEIGAEISFWCMDRRHLFMHSPIHHVCGPAVHNMCVCACVLFLFRFFSFAHFPAVTLFGAPLLIYILQLHEYRMTAC